MDFSDFLFLHPKISFTLSNWLLFSLFPAVGIFKELNDIKHSSNTTAVVIILMSILASEALVKVEV